MPKRLPDRFRPDSIAEFRAAARQRSLDAITLEADGRRAGALYLWGYVAEMALKAAYFRALGFPDSRPITRSDLRGGLSILPNLAKNPPLHHLGLWAQALVVLRAGTPGLAYPDPTFGSLVTAKAQAIYGIWRETLRYHKNLPYPREMIQVREAAEWLLVQSLDL
jgi:hypothetical protein